MTLPCETIVHKAREMLVASKQWGGAVESGILSGAFDDGSIIAEWFDRAEQDLLKHQIENISDD